jgi:hypothetical protein
MRWSMSSPISSHARLASLTALVLVAAASCTDATGHISGGDALYSVPDASADPDLGLGTGTTFTDLYNDFFGPMSKAFPNAKGQAGCAGIGQCHGDPTQPGAMATGGYVCPSADFNVGGSDGGVEGGADGGAEGGAEGGADGGVEGGAEGGADSGVGGGALSIKEVCRTTMMKTILTCGQPFDNSYMKSVIRKQTHKPDDENNMPRTPYTYTFSDKGVARIAAWVESGCPDN